MNMLVFRQWKSERISIKDSKKKRKGYFITYEH